jgi:hypothetical protein
MKTFRFDDICGNASIKRDVEVAAAIREHYPNAKIIFGVSPLVHPHQECGERVYPAILNAGSDIRPFFRPTKCWTPPQLPSFIKLAGHGLWHIDHRLLTPELQEASILTSCSLVGAEIFIPPFNKWTPYMMEVCRHEGIELIIFEDGWLSMEHNDFDDRHRMWYLHARHWNVEKITNYLNKGK